MHLPRREELVRVQAAGGRVGGTYSQQGWFTSPWSRDEAGEHGDSLLVEI